MRGGALVKREPISREESRQGEGLSRSWESVRKSKRGLMWGQKKANRGRGERKTSSTKGGASNRIYWEGLLGKKEPTKGGQGGETLSTILKGGPSVPRGGLFRRSKNSPERNGRGSEFRNSSIRQRRRIRLCSVLRGMERNA